MNDFLPDFARPVLLTTAYGCVAPAHRPCRILGGVHQGVRALAFCAFKQSFGVQINPI